MGGRIMAAHKLTARKVSDLRRQYKDGARDVDLAEWFCVSEGTIRYHTRDMRRASPRLTIDHGRHKMTARQVSELRSLWNDPDSSLRKADLAAMYSVSEATVRYHLRRA